MLLSLLHCQLLHRQRGGGKAKITFSPKFRLGFQKLNLDSGEGQNTMSLKLQSKSASKSASGPPQTKKRKLSVVVKAAVAEKKMKSEEKKPAKKQQIEKGWRLVELGDGLIGFQKYKIRQINLSKSNVTA
jgi:hypothetical protein